jgi:hypothetical protein
VRPESLNFGTAAPFGVSRPDAKECLERTDHDGSHVEVIVESALFRGSPDGLWQFDGGFDASMCPLHGIRSAFRMPVPNSLRMETASGRIYEGLVPLAARSDNCCGKP